jgi:hypothetical protein
MFSVRGPHSDFVPAKKKPSVKKKKEEVTSIEEV